MERWLVYTTGDADYPEGWSLVDLGLDGQYRPNRCLADTTAPFGWRTGYPDFYAVEEGLTVSLDGLPTELVLAGTFGELAAGALTLQGVPYQQLVDDSLGWPSLYELPIADTFSVTLSDEPPDEQDMGSDPDWRYTMAINLVGDADGYDGAATCLDGESVYTRYTRTVDSWRGYRFLDCYTGTVGWRAARTDPDTEAVVYLSAEEAASLTVDNTCSW
jgi:hypothetical protein